MHPFAISSMLMTTKLKTSERYFQIPMRLFHQISPPKYCTSTTFGKPQTHYLIFQTWPPSWLKIVLLLLSPS